MTVALASVPRQDLGRTADPQPGSALPVHLSYRRCSEVNSASPIFGVQASTKDCRRPSLRGNHGQASKNHAGYWGHPNRLYSEGHTWASSTACTLFQID